MTDQIHAGKSVLITGAASGIGEAAAKVFAKAGASVLLADVQIDRGESVAAELRKAGARAVFVKCDVRVEGDIQAAVARAVQEFGALNMAYNNAGVDGARAPTGECTNENWDRIIEIDLRGVWWCVKHEIRAMLKAGGGGAIVNCASIAGLVGMMNIPAYVAAKHGVVGLTKAAALEYGPRNIRVNAVCPGVTETPINVANIADPEKWAKLVEATPMARVAQPQEIAEAASWLCSPAASFVTGQALAVDGGWVAR